VTGLKARVVGRRLEVELADEHDLEQLLEALHARP
jgi:hypothetical protein